MTREWYLRDYLLELSQKWYLIVVCFAVGALIGWGVSFIKPTIYRADLDLYVGIDPYRALRDRYVAGAAQDEFRNIDDYKNWQMEQLNTLVLQDDFLVDTLARLQDVDLAWEETSIVDLRTMLEGSWRNAGRWHLRAEALHPDIATQAVTAWGQVIDEHTQQALEHARQLIALDSQLTAVAEQETTLELRSTALTHAQEKLHVVIDELNKRPSGSLLKSFEYWQLTAYASQSADRSLGWQNILETQPAIDAELFLHQTWVEKVLAQIASDLELIPNQITLLETLHTAVAMKYGREAELSLALSANLDIEMPEGETASVEAVRSTNLFMLLGGFLALLAWLFLKLARFSQQGDA